MVADGLWGFVHNLFQSRAARVRPFFNADTILANINKGERFSHKIWGPMSFEVWQQMFHEKAAEIGIDKVSDGRARSRCVVAIVGVNLS